MAQAAVDVLDLIGLTPDPRCAVWAYGFDGEAVKSYLADPRRTQRRQSLVDFWYRTSPEPMFATTDPLNPFITPQDPPLTTPGMVLVRLNTKRRLILLERVPPRIEAVQDAKNIDWSRYFAAAGLDHAACVPATPVWTPPFAFDSRSAWVERQETDPLHVEAAAWHGVPIFFRAGHDRPTQVASAPTAVGFVVHNIAVLAILTVLVWINLRKHRGDIGGARRFGVAIAAVTFLYQCLAMTHALTLQGWRAFVAGWGNALWAGSYAFLGYLALEPNLSGAGHML